jgi:hypothetical protein
MEKPSLLPLLDGLLPLDEAKVAEAAREAGVARARGFARLRKEAEGTYPPLGLEALSPVYLRFQDGARFVVYAPLHFAEAPANRLTHSALDPISHIPEYKVSAVRPEKAD